MQRARIWPEGVFKRTQFPALKQLLFAAIVASYCEITTFLMCSQYSLVPWVASESCISHFHGTTCSWCQKMRFGEKLRGAKW